MNLPRYDDGASALGQTQGDTPDKDELVSTPDLAPRDDADHAPATPGPPPKPARRRIKLRWWHLVLTAVLSPIVVFAGANMLAASLYGGMDDGFADEQEVEVVRTDLTHTVSLSGTIQPTQRLDLSFSAEGEVTSVRVAVGDSVSAGTPLASIDDSALRDAVADAQAENDAASKDYQDARKGGQATAINAMRSAYNLKAQALKDARAALDKATLVSTIDGVVAAVNVQVGDLAGASGTGSPPGAGASSDQAAIVVISRTFQVDATVGAAERGRVAKGMTATVTTSSSPTPLTGTVTAVGVVAETSDTPDRPSAATFKVTVTLDGQPDTVFTGAAASVEVNAEGKTGVLAVPVAALIERSGETDAAVRTRRGDETTATPIVIGVTVGDMVEVVSGLTEGDLVIVPVVMGTDAAGGGAATADAVGVAERPR